ncbi:MAG: Abi family protein [Propionibacteriaceae bacterium]|nr:Abi family protein [Propionibacteriaceae bacterium]
MKVPPFLTAREQVKYLYAKNYVEPDSITPDEQARLAELNFHHLLGYARNYRALVGRKQITVPSKSLSDVLSVIDGDTQLSALLHEGLRVAECHLRAVIIKHYCSKFDPAGSYLQRSQYLATSQGSDEHLVKAILTHIFRHDEPYILDVLKRSAEEKGLPCPKEYDQSNHQNCAKVADSLPLWAVVDSFSLGLLGRFVMACDTDKTQPVWKAVANDLNISKQVFETQLKSLTYLRNCVAHHARLWMRPTADSPKKPRLFESRLRGSDPKSMYWALMNLATFLPDSQRRPFADRIDTLLENNHLHRHGIRRASS